MHELQTVEIFRERKKAVVITHSLQEQITSKHVIYPHFGQGLFIEFHFTNPYGEPHNFQVNFDDHELRLVLDTDEWRYLKRVNRIRTGVEHQMITRDPEGKYEIYLEGNEVVAIPFLFKSMHCGQIHAENRQVRGDDAIGTLAEEDIITEYDATRPTSQELLPTQPAQPIQARTINVALLNKTRKPVALLDVIVNPQYFAVDATFRFYKTGGDYIRKSIRLPPPKSGRVVNGETTTYDSSKPYQKFLACSHPDVVYALKETVRIPLLQS